MKSQSSTPSAVSSAVRRHRKLSAAFAAGSLSLTLLASSGFATTVSDGFESFTGGAGNTVNGYNGWTTAASPLDAVVNMDATAYQGSYYLRLPDLSPSTQISASKFFATPVYADGASISFALRDAGGANPAASNNDQVVLNTDQGVPAFQVGLQANSSSTTKITSTSHSGSAIGANTQLSTVGIPINNDWILFTITYAISGSASAYTGTYSLTAMDTTTGTVYVNNTMNISGQTAFANLPSFTSLVVQTSGSGAGNADLDSLVISSTPEPASSAALIALAGSFMIRRRSGRKSVGPG